jgi:hypothetical protein
MKALVTTCSYNSQEFDKSNYRTTHNTYKCLVLAMGTN